jgi:hypothetical protein
MKKMLLVLLVAASAFASPRQNLVVDAAWLKNRDADQEDRDAAEELSTPPLRVSA